MKMKQMRSERSARTRAIWLGLAAAIVAAGFGAVSEAGPIRDRLAARKASNEPAPGLAREELSHDGRQRVYFVHAAANLARGAPLVLVFHGGRGSGDKIAKEARIVDIADREGFVVAFPNSVGRNWNDGRPPTNNNVDDVGFVSALIDQLARTRGIDTRRVYATGMSNGGIFSFRLGCELSSRIAAIAPVVGSLSADLSPGCRPTRPVPVLMFNGTADTFIPWAGGEVSKGEGGRILPIPETIGFWARNNGCSGTPQKRRLEDSDPSDGTTVEVAAYLDCRDNATVTSYAIQGGGHTWPGGAALLPQRMVGNTTRDIDGSLLMWDFFKRHALP
jgi:polyhydroxybutyrate depolymerase